MAVNYKETSFMEQAPGHAALSLGAFHNHNSLPLEYTVFISLYERTP